MKHHAHTTIGKTAFRAMSAIFACLLSVSLLASCDAESGGDIGGMASPDYQYSLDGGFSFETAEDEETEGFLENEFINVTDEPISTFSADVDTASYAYFRKLVNQGHSFTNIRKNFGTSIRTEEMLNYFTYNGAEPVGDDLFGVRAELAACPWNAENALLMLNLTAEAAVPNENGNNLVFLIDVSGSMASEDKLPLLKSAFSQLVYQLSIKDRISIVTYSGRETVVLEGCRGDDKARILNAIDSLEASGSTNGQAGLQKAYELAESCKINGGNNRIIMASDGDLNVGISSAEELKTYIAEKRDMGIYLSVLGFGTGNYKDANMEALADNGNGVYYYIDGQEEANRIFGDAILSTLYTVAEDVKLQITFSSPYVESYRLIGYENRLLSTEDFENDTKDAGEVGAGHTLTVCYELRLNRDAESTASSTASPSFTIGGSSSACSFFTLETRHKKPGESESILNTYTFDSTLFTDIPSEDFRFASCVIATAMLLHNSEHIGNVSLPAVIEALASLELTDPMRAEFLVLLKTAQSNEYSF